MIFVTPSAQHLLTNMPHGRCTFKQFSDGEWQVQVHEQVADQQVWIVAHTGAPADNLVQLMLLGDALRREGAQLRLVLTYFGYARQDRQFPGEPVAAELMCTILALLAPLSIDVIHIHNPAIGAGILTNHIPFEFFMPISKEADIIAAPDKGAHQLGKIIAERAGKELVQFEKIRPVPEQVTLQVTGDVTGKRVLIVDDMITTGRTVRQAAELLHQKGAQSVRVAATHGVFSAGAREALEQSSIEHVYVTNTLPQSAAGKVSVIDCSAFISTIMAGRS